MSKWPTYEEAEVILSEWTRNKNLRKHAYAVEAAMRAYAAKFSEDPEKWGIVGLLHDFDYERFPDLKDHPFKGVEWLRAQGYDEELLKGILAHADHSGEPRDTRMKQAIAAVDELTGLIVAVSLVRPSKKIAEVDVAAVQKKWREKSFAAGADRAGIERGAAELGVPLDQHIGNVLEAMKGISEKLGL